MGLSDKLTVFCVLCALIIGGASDHETDNTTGSDEFIPHQMSQLYARKVINSFVSKGAMSIKDFEKMLISLEETEMKSPDTSECVDAMRILAAIESQSDDEKNLTSSFMIDDDHLITACPTLLHHILSQESFMSEASCLEAEKTVKEVESRASVWFYSTLALIAISLCGLAGVIVIPIVDKHYYFYVLQYFMALAVGTLTGDALLHLLPHSMRAINDEMTKPELLEMMMHRGLAALLGIISFCMVERGLATITKLKNRGKAQEESTTDASKVQNHSHKHGHGHSHGQVDSQSESLSSIVWMVILGDGLHNFTDGMAIGAAFSNSIAGGFSTTVAVFCHELPHEMGDFAVLLKAGMSARKAIYYNILSSILSFLGMCVGILIGEAPEATQWVFAAAAGLFIYIALVDMVSKFKFNAIKSF